MEGEAAIPVDSCCNSSGDTQLLHINTVPVDDSHNSSALKIKTLPSESGPHLPSSVIGGSLPSSPTSDLRHKESRTDVTLTDTTEDTAADYAESSVNLHNDYLPTTSIPQNEERGIALNLDTQDIPNDDVDVAGDGLFFGPPDLTPLTASARSIEEDHTIILHRSSSVASKSSNTKYKCLYCSFTFVGGPQKIRVHLTGKRENGTRLSRCENCPEEVRKMMENRMRSPRDGLTENGNFEDDDDDDEEDGTAQSLPPRNTEENHCIILARSSSALSKSSNTRYKCIYCRFKFVGGPQKIRVHLTGHPEGGTKITKCPRVPQEVVEQMGHRRKIPKVNDFSSPTMSLTAASLMPTLAMASQQQPQQMSNLYQHQQQQLQMQLQHHHQQQLQQHQLQQIQMHQQQQMHQHHQQHQLQQMHQMQQLHMVGALPPQTNHQLQMQMQGLVPVISGPHPQASVMSMPMFSISLPTAHAQMLMQQQLQQQYGMAMNPLMHSMQQQQILMQHQHQIQQANLINSTSSNNSHDSNDNDSS